VISERLLGSRPDGGGDALSAIPAVIFCSGCGHSPHEDRCTSNVHGEECGCEQVIFGEKRTS
jgi:hypothetical protein